MRWYENRYRRHLLDMHIEDWDERFLSEFSPETYVENLKLAHINAPMIYLQAHTGHCYWPTKSGHMHSALRGREDMLRRLTDLCHEAGMSVVGYYSLIYNVYEEDRHPEWRLRDPEGRSPRQRGGRYGLCCPNQPEYREFVDAQIREMGEYFKLDGIFYDMLFWPEFCCCDKCAERWKRETGYEEMPTKEDWHDPVWRLWVRKHQEWMGEFAAWAKERTAIWMPGVTVEQNYASGVAGDWHNGAAAPVNEACDYTGGDLYGDLYNHSFAAKYYHGISKAEPFEYMVCRCDAALKQHTVTKTEARLTTEAFLTAAHHGASLIIDAIDPVGTMDSRVYARIGKVFEKEMPLEPYFRGRLRADVGVYYSPRGRFDPEGQGFHNLDAAVGAVRALIAAHVPVDVVSEGSREPLERFPVVMAPAVNGLTDGERERIAAYVKGGGVLYLSGALEPELLKTLTGGEYTGMTEHDRTYLAPMPGTEDLFDWFTPKYPMPFGYRLPVVRFPEDGETLATLTVPYTLPGERKFASIHSNPPGPGTDIPLLRVNRCGKGTVIWSAASPEIDDRVDYRKLLMGLLRRYLPESAQTVSADGSELCEVTRFDDGKSVILHAILLSESPKPMTVPGFTLRVKLDAPAKTLRAIPSGEELPYVQEADGISFRTGDVTAWAAWEIETE